MSDSMRPFYEVLEDRHGWIRRHKAETGRGIAGYFCDYLPEEIAWAAGYTTVRITGGRGHVVSADRHLQSNVCSFARRCLDQALEGVYDYLDALLIPHTCDVITKMYDLWAYRLKGPDFIHYFWTPHKVFDPSAPAVMEGEIRRLKKCLEDHTKKPLDDAALLEAIAVYDKSRSLLKRIYELRRQSPPLISGVEAFAVSLSSLLSPKDTHAQWMEALLAERESAPPRLENRPRVLISASMLDDLEIIRAIEDSGAWVVADDVCSGSRYFWDVVGEAGSMPLKAITHRYLNKTPCPRSVGSLTPRLNHILNMVREYRVNGVIFYILRCCDAHLFQYPILNERLQKAGLKVLYVQGDQTVGVNEALVNRITAFTEMISA